MGLTQATSVSATSSARAVGGRCPRHSEIESCAADRSSESRLAAGAQTTTEACAGPWHTCRWAPPTSETSGAPIPMRWSRCPQVGALPPRPERHSWRRRALRHGKGEVSDRADVPLDLPAKRESPASARAPVSVAAARTQLREPARAHRGIPLRPDRLQRACKHRMLEFGELRGRSDLSPKHPRRIRAGLVISAEARVSPYPPPRKSRGGWTHLQLLCAPARQAGPAGGESDMEGVLSSAVVGGCAVGCVRGAGGAARAEGPVWSTAGSD